MSSISQHAQNDLPKAPVPAIPQKLQTAATDFAAWDTLAADDKVRFITGIVQLVATGEGHILVQPIERSKWHGLIEAGLILLDEHDDYILRLTTTGSIAFNLVLGAYLPVEDMEAVHERSH